MLSGILSVFLLLWETSNCGKWTHSKVLDVGHYQVHWRIKDDTIVFRTEVNSKGYVGFGLSRNGAMAGSDIVIGWLKDGEVYFHDRHGIGNVMPVLDDQQDWRLLHAMENDTHTIFEFYRKLQTCDEDDLEISDSTLRLIYAYSEEDPTSVDRIPYHFENRGFTSVRFLSRHVPKRINTEGMLYWDVRNNYRLKPEVKSMYWCKLIKSPQLTGKKHHALQIQKVVQPGNEKNVHHMLLHGCRRDNPELLESNLDLGFPCHNHSNVMKQCDNLLFSYSIGGQDLEFPENAGYPFESDEYYVFEVHYDNAGGFDKEDNSGFRIFYTPHLRQYDMGILATGAMPAPSLIIPPQRERYTVSSHVNFTQFHHSTNFPPNGIYIVSMNLHAHKKGKHIIARHFRGNKELKPILEDKNFDFAYQHYEILGEEVHVLPDDHITVECVYNTMDTDKATLGGSSTAKEMCEANFYYYPQFEFPMCFSTPLFERILEQTGIIAPRVERQNAFSEKSIEKAMENLDWSKIDVQKFEKLNRYYPQLSCVAVFGKNFSKDDALVKYPKDYVPYIQPNMCKKDLPMLQDTNNKLSGGLKIKTECSMLLLIQLLMFLLLSNF